MAVLLAARCDALAKGVAVGSMGHPDWPALADAANVKIRGQVQAALRLESPALLQTRSSSQGTDRDAVQITLYRRVDGSDAPRDVRARSKYALRLGARGTVLGVLDDADFDLEDELQLEQFVRHLHSHLSEHA